MSSMLVKVSLIDVNDNPPVFTSDLYEISITEDIPVGMNILQVMSEAIIISVLSEDSFESHPLLLVIKTIPYDV